MALSGHFQKFFESAPGLLFTRNRIGVTQPRQTDVTVLVDCASFHKFGDCLIVHPLLLVKQPQAIIARGSGVKLPRFPKFLNRLIGTARQMVQPCDK